MTWMSQFNSILDTVDVVVGPTEKVTRVKQQKYFKEPNNEGPNCILEVDFYPVRFIMALHVNSWLN